MSRDPRLYLDDIIESCRKVARYVRGLNQDEAMRNELIVDAILRNLLVIGEAAKKLPDEWKQQYGDVEWRKIAGLRDVIAHEYFQLDEEILWDVVSNKLPELERVVSRMLNELL
ncbi:HepT-like ribonuclease domain-containing protein [Oceanithermus sp.]